MEPGNEDMFLGGDHAHQLREELQRMDRELSTPCRTPTKRPRADEDSDDSDSNLESDSDVQQGSSEGDVQTDITQQIRRKEGEYQPSYVSLVVALLDQISSHAQNNLLRSRSHNVGITT